MLSEFEIIDKYFKREFGNDLLGIGDDAAAISISANTELLVGIDTMVEGQHFFANCDAFSLGHKLLAVNLSDIAAMGGKPKWATLSLAIPDTDSNWLGEFSSGLFSLADRYNTKLIGGDTTKSAQKVLTLQIIGEAVNGSKVLRSGAKPQDLIFVSGHLGEAAFELSNISAGHCAISASLEKPIPQVELGMALNGKVNSMIDISDGLLQDIGHILKASNVGAYIQADLIPLASSLKSLKDGVKYKYALTGGEDYQLCFTAEPSKAPYIYEAAENIGVKITHIGTIVENLGLSLENCPVSIENPGYKHF